MRPFVVTLCAVALAVVLGSPPASAFTQEPIPGTAGGSASEQRLADPGSGEDGAAGRDRSPFSFSVTGPGARTGPNVNRPGADNRHLYWDNTSNRHDVFDRDSIRRRHR
jgi:hypothetical protein